MKRRLDAKAAPTSQPAVQQEPDPLADLLQRCGFAIAFTGTDLNAHKINRKQALRKLRSALEKLKGADLALSDTIAA